MAVLLSGVAILLGSAFLSLASGRGFKTATRIGSVGAWGGSLLSLGAAVSFLAQGNSLGGRAGEWLVRIPWTLPFASLNVGLDGLSAFFVVVIALGAAFSAVYGVAYLDAHHQEKHYGAKWFFFNTLVASMLLVVIARNAVLFLLAWEVMTLSSFFLVMFEHEKEQSRHAGFIYLVASHVGTAFIFLLWLVLGRNAGVLDFDQFTTTGLPVGMLFVFALIGFGTKAGLIPVHVWLPEAHPAAPSHVSALMSGVMIKCGIYGLLRALMFLGHPQWWWGVVLIVVGFASAISGILYALAQHDLKKLLAYSTVENAGLITMGIGVGVLGMSLNNPILMVLGFAGALMHVLNHSLFKSLLFFGAGTVIHLTGAREMNDLGGLIRRSPVFGVLFLIGAFAIVGLPPLNGFVGEFLIFLGAYHGVVLLRASVATVPAILVILGLGLAGGLAAVCFTKVFGTVFLGEPRTDHRASSRMPEHAVPVSMLRPMVGLAALCVLLGATGPLWVRFLIPVLDRIIGAGSAPLVASVLDYVSSPLWLMTGTATAFVALLGLIAAIRARLLSKRPVGETVTWDCGYAAPTARMQYTASSFAQPTAGVFGALLRKKVRATLPHGYFPQASGFFTDTPDGFRRYGFEPLFAWVERHLLRFRPLQHGRLQLYILYIVLTLIALLVWLFLWEAKH